MKDKRKLMEDASEAWVMEDPDKRTIFCVIGDKETNTTSCGASGREDLIVEAIVNEMLSDETIAQLVLTSAQVYNNIIEEEKKEKKQELKKTTKIYS
jgi:ribosomal protein L13